MALFLVTRPRGADHLRNPSGIHAALVDAADGPAAILAANALAPTSTAPSTASTPRRSQPRRRAASPPACSRAMPWARPTPARGAAHDARAPD